MSGVLRWEGPPPTRHGGGHCERHNLSDAAPELVARPGEWALLLLAESHGTAAAQAAHIRAGRLVAFRPRGSFEATVRDVDGEHRVYVRYVGGAQ